MKILAGIFFLVASHASKNIELEENLHSKPGSDDCKANDVMIEFKNLEKQMENLPNSAEEIKTGEVLIDHSDLTMQKTQTATLDEIFTKQLLVRKVLSYLETDTDQFAVLNTCKSFTNAMLTLYKQSIRNYPSEPEIYSFDRILCLSAIDFRFQKAFREEVAENKPDFFTQFHDYVKAKAQKIPDCEEYIEHGKLYDWNFNRITLLHNVESEAPSGNMSEYKEYEKLTNERTKIVNEALRKVNKYNKPREMELSLIKKTDRFNGAGLLLVFILYVPFIFLPFQSEASFLHLILATFSFVFNICSCCLIALFIQARGFYAQIPKKVLKLYYGFGFVTGIFNLIGILPQYYSFVTFVLTKIFIGSFFFLPIILVLLRAAYRDYISKSTVAPNEIQKAKKAIRSIQRFFFVAI